MVCKEHMMIMDTHNNRKCIICNQHWDIHALPVHNVRVLFLPEQEMSFNPTETRDSNRFGEIIIYNE